MTPAEALDANDDADERRASPRRLPGCGSTPWTGCGASWCGSTARAGDGKRDVRTPAARQHAAMIARILEGSDLEKRITALEQQRRSER